MWLGIQSGLSMNNWRIWGMKITDVTACTVHNLNFLVLGAEPYIQACMKNFLTTLQVISRVVISIECGMLYCMLCPMLYPCVYCGNIMLLWYRVGHAENTVCIPCLVVFLLYAVQNKMMSFNVLTTSACVCMCCFVALGWYYISPNLLLFRLFLLKAVWSHIT